MQILIYIDGVDVTSRVLLADTRIAQSANGRVLDCSLGLRPTAAEGAVYDLARYDSARYDQFVSGAQDSYLLKEVLIRRAADNALLYRGTVTALRINEPVGQPWKYDLTLRDYSAILDARTVPAESFAGTTDQAIITVLISEYAPEVDTTNVSSLLTVPAFAVKDKTLRAALDDLAKLTHAQYWITPDKALYWQSRLTLDACQYKLTDNRQDPQWFAAQIGECSDDRTQFANRVRVLGGVDEEGNEIVAIAESASSIAARGLHERTILARDIDTQAVADILAEAELDERLTPQASGTFRTTTQGFAVGQRLTVSLPNLGISGEYAITSVSARWVRPDLTEWEVQFGSKPSIVDMLRAIKSPPKASTGAVTDAQITSVSASKIVGQLTAAQIGAVNASAVQGTISADHIGSVNAAVIQGVITSSQVTDGLIDSLSKYTNPLRPIPIRTSDPALPSADFPAGSFYFNSSTSQWRKNNAGTWLNSTEAEAISGKLDFYLVGSLKADRIIGQIVAAQIGSVNANTINGQITAGQLAGGITADKIASVSAATITGGITSGQITSVATSTLTGTIQANQIAAVNASTIQGGIQANQITAVNASAIQGGITAGQITSVNATAITGLITADKIDSVNASSITGNISADRIPVVNVGALNGQITTGQIANLAITGGKIANLTITGDNIANATISSAKIVSLSADKIDTGTLKAGVVYSGTINASQINSSSSNTFGPIWSSGSITASGGVYSDSGDVVASSGYIRGAGLEVTGSSVSLSGGAVSSFRSLLCDGVYSPVGHTHSPQICGSWVSTSTWESHISDWNSHLSVEHASISAALSSLESRVAALESQ